MKKTIILITIIALIIVLGVLVGKKISQNEQFEPVNSNKIEQNTNKIMENILENKSNTANVVENVVEEKPEEKPEEDKIEEPKTDLEKAIEIVKNNWGEDNSVFFDETDTTNEQKAKGEYTICVREKSTTNAKAWYTVDVQNGTAKKWD